MHESQVGPKCFNTASFVIIFWHLLKFCCFISEKISLNVRDINRGKVRTAVFDQIDQWEFMYMSQDIKTIKF